MAINYSSILKLPKPDQGTPSWATYWHRMADILDGGVVTVTKAAGATTLPDANGVADSGKRGIIRTTQTLTATTVVNVPAKPKMWFVENLSGGTGRFKIQLATNNVGVFVPKGKRMWLRASATAVVAASHGDGRGTATEIGIGVLTATHIASNAITTAKITDGNVTLAKLAAAGSYGRIMVSATGTFGWTTLARGTARQVLAMSTHANSRPVWADQAFSRTAFSTAMTVAANTIVTYTHGLSGIANNYDVRHLYVALVCVSSDLGYSAGDVAYIASNSGYDVVGWALVVDSTSTVKLVIRQLALPHKSTFALTIIDHSKWRARFGVIL